MTAAPARRWPAALLGAGVLLGACSNHGSNADLKPHPLPGSATSVVDYSGVALAKVPGNTTTTLQTKGTATITGSVTGPSGLVPGATVRVERLVGDQVVRTDVATGPDGRFAVPNIPGGRYRVRAFLAPALALVTPDVRFIPDGQQTTVDLTVADQRTVVARAGVAPQTPYIGDDVNLAVVVANRTVDGDGVVRSVPLPFLRVELSGLGAYVLAPRDTSAGLAPHGTTTTTALSFDPPTMAFTDSQGQVQYALRCAQSATPGLELLVTVTVTPAQVAGQPPAQPEQQVQHLALNVPACIDPTATATTSVGGSTTSSTSPSSTTTRPPATSTTRPGPRTTG